MLFIFWLVLLLPWLFVPSFSPMAFDGGRTAEAYAFFWSVWVYPVTVGAVARFRRWRPSLVVLPFLSIAGCCATLLVRKGVSDGPNSPRKTPLERVRTCINWYIKEPMHPT